MEFQLSIEMNLSNTNNSKPVFKKVDYITTVKKHSYFSTKSFIPNLKIIAF